MKNYKIAVAGTGYVGLSLGVLFAQHHQVVAVDIVQAKVDMINNKKYSDCTVDDIVEKYIEGTPEVGSVGVHVDDTNRPKKSTDVIKGSNNEDSTLTEGTLFYDVRFDAIAPKSADSAEQEEVIRLIINVEAQTKFKPG